MKYRFSNISKRRLMGIHPDLRRVLARALRRGLIDFTVVCGYRGCREQTEAWEEGKTLLRFPKSKHNCKPSRAVDIAPYVNGRLSFNKLHMSYLAGVVQATAEEMDISLRWGGNWDRDGEPITDQRFDDLCHFELGEEH